MLDSVAILLMVLTTFNQVDVGNFDFEEAHCMAMNIYHESRGETLSGKIAVAQVTMTRVKDPRFPNSICGVVKQATHMRKGAPSTPRLHKCAFSWYCDGVSDNINFHKGVVLDDAKVLAFSESVVIAILAIGGAINDNTFGATHYYNKRLAAPKWANIYPITTEIGNHVFHRRPMGSRL